MSYESSYDTGGGPFRPNKDRGFWSSPRDFFFACLSNALRMDCMYGIAILPFFENAGILLVASYTVNVLLYSLPIIFIQTFLGQFSSSGFISVFRISPLFKGLGYIGLVINLFSLAFFGIFAAVPLLMFFHSLQPTLPWSCEGAMENDVYYNNSHCNIDLINSKVDNDLPILMSIPSREYIVNLHTTFSFPLFGCVLAIWGAVAFALYKSTETIGQIFRYCAITVFSILMVIFVRMTFMPTTRVGLVQGYVKPEVIEWKTVIAAAPIFMLTSFGPGWGTVLTMASYNKFKTNITKYSLVVCFSQFGALLLVGLVVAFTEAHLTQNKLNALTTTFEYHWMTFLAVPSSLATLELPHLWTWMFFAVLIMGTFNLVLLQMFSVLTALLDEFEKLRMYRRELIFGITGGLALVSAIFCKEKGIDFIEVLAHVNLLAQALLNFLLLFVVVWVYGRERFQRDVEFMTSQVLATWKVLVFRLATPVFLSISLFILGLLVSFTHYRAGMGHLLPFSLVLQALPWLILPGYCVCKLMQATGTIRLRFKRCTRPTDWYPVDPDDKQRYEEAFDVAKITHPLTTIVL